MNARVLKSKLANRLKRKKRVRSKISGTAELPRVSVFRSNRYLTVQATLLQNLPQSSKRKTSRRSYSIVTVTNIMALLLRLVMHSVQTKSSSRGHNGNQ